MFMIEKYVDLLLMIFCIYLLYYILFFFKQFGSVDIFLPGWKK